MDDQPEETVLDARGLKCPLPVLKARRVLKNVTPGGLLHVLATDPGADKDFAHFCETTGCIMVKKSREGEELHFVLRKPA